MLKKIRDKVDEFGREHRLFLIYSVIFFAAYAMFLNYSITSDHVAAYSVSSGVTMKSLGRYFESGRYMNLVIDIFYCLFRLMGVTHVTNRWVLQIILMLFCAVTSERLVKLYKPSFPDKEWFLVLIVSLNFINPYFVESFVYAGAELGLGILLVELAVEKFVGKRYILSGIFLFCGVSVYQSYIALFLIWLFAYIYVDNSHERFRVAIGKYSVACGITIVAALVNIVIGKIALVTNLATIEVKKIGVGNDILTKIKVICAYVIRGTVELYKVCPGYYFFAGCFLIGVVAVCYLLGKNKSIWEVIHLGVVAVMILLFPYAIAIVMIDIWLPPRVLWVIFPSYSVIILMCYRIVCDNVLLRKVVMTAASILMMAVYFGMITTELDYYIAYALDTYNMRMIQNEIEEYEKESGYRVKKIIVGKADNVQYYYDEACHFDYYGVMYTHKTHFDTWADVALLNRVNGTDYLRKEMSDEDKERLFGGKVSANVFNSSEQLVFDGECMYWLIF